MQHSTYSGLALHECSQGLHYYPFTVKLGKCFESCNTLSDLSNKVCVPNKIEDLNINVFNMITEKKLIKNINKRYVMWM